MVETVSMVLAVFVVVFRIIWRQRLNLTPVFDLGKSAADFFTAAALVPFLLMFGTAISDRFLQELLALGKGPVWLAGGVGVLVLLREITTKPK